MDRWSLVFVAALLVAVVGAGMTPSNAHKTDNTQLAADYGAPAWPALVKRTPVSP